MGRSIIEDVIAKERKKTLPRKKPHIKADYGVDPHIPDKKPYGDAGKEEKRSTADPFKTHLIKAYKYVDDEMPEALSRLINKDDPTS